MIIDVFRKGNCITGLCQEEDGAGYAAVSTDPPVTPWFMISPVSAGLAQSP